MNNEVTKFLQQNMNFNGQGPYIGSADPSLQFGGSASSILNENAGGMEFGFTLANSTAATKYIAITSTYLGSASAIATATGLTVDYVLADGTIATNITGTANNSSLTIDNFQKWVNENPTAITEVEIQSNSEEAWKQNLIVARVNPFKRPGSEELPLTRYLDQYQQNVKKITIPMLKEMPGLQFDNQTVVIIPIGGTNVVATTGVSLQFWFRAGTILNTAGELANKRALAFSNAEKMASLQSIASRV